MSAADSFSVEIKLVSKEDLPAQCPPKDSSVWNMHPKVFLSFNAEGNASCPYCGAKYKLDE
ncbi:MAG: zinc-finger domain-containing protein [Candidatus Thioglobus sp.]|nr:zinc-finger domain-containing protein [Candidatus Thioglobus sp.]